MAKREPKLTLVIDVSSPLLQLGIPNNSSWEAIITDEGQAMDGLFRGLNKLFEKRADSLNSVDTIYYCCGPGSTLGLRLAAALVKTIIWEANGRISLYQYNALDLASSLPNISTNFIQAPFRMGKRFLRTGEPKSIGKKDILPQDIALSDYPDSMHLLGPRQISVKIPEDKIINYALEDIGGVDELSLISEPAEHPVPYSPEPTTFKKWDGKIPAKQQTS
jgi:hypothetical protein